LFVILFVAANGDRALFGWMPIHLPFYEPQTFHRHSMVAGYLIRRQEGKQVDSLDG
jgi:hypothetical protein